MQNADAALVLFSGDAGLHHVSRLGTEHFTRVETVGFSYGQRHAVEPDCRQPIRENLVRLKPVARPAWARIGCSMPPY